MKTVQYFNDEYLKLTRHASPEQILEYLEHYRLMQLANNSPSKLISIKIPHQQLNLFRAKCEIEGKKYQTQIKKLMSEWLNL